MHKALQCLSAAFCVLAIAASAFAFAELDPPPPLIDQAGAGVFVLDGRFVHTAGQLQLNITNWGLIGSRPGLDSSYSAAPSAMWPAGSGIDYLFAAGLWVGAVKDGVPLVSTGQYDYEFMPLPQPTETIYETRRGEPGGNRYPFDEEDDDGDGLVNEDVKDGIDNDQDGRVDEDYAAISNQSFRFHMVDNNPLAEELWPEHQPLDLEVTQQTYQWDSHQLEDGVAFDFEVRNIGARPLEDVAIGFFADPDVGPRSGTQPGQDDVVGVDTARFTATDGLPIQFSYAYAYDCPGIDGDIQGVIGFVFLNSTDPPTFQSLPSFHWFTENVPFERGGEPRTDLDRYTLLTSREIQAPPADCQFAADYRLLIGYQHPSGRLLMPGASLRFQMGIVAGSDLQDLRENIEAMLLAYYGRWFDRDGDPTTGLLGRETYVCPPPDFNPRTQPNPVLGLPLDCGDPLLEECRDPLFKSKVVESGDLDENGCAWVNMDCEYEFARGRGLCSCFGRQFDVTIEDLDLPCTGREGKEHNVRWIANAPPNSPRTRVWATDNRVHLFWSDEAEDFRDQDFGVPAFEGYRIWRAEDWTRPAGTSTRTGPNSELWDLIAEFDVVDNYERIRGPLRETLPLGANTGLDLINYVPRVLRTESTEATRYAPLRELVEQIVYDHPLLTRFDQIRYRNLDGSVTALGTLYPELIDWECCSDTVDTLMWNAMDVHWYEYVDRGLVNGMFYFHAVTTTTADFSELSDGVFPTGPGIASSPHGNFQFTVPQSPAQSREQRDRLGQNIYVVPNPATRAALGEFSQLQPNADDPTGVRIEWRNLPAARNRVRVFTLSGDLVVDLQHDGRSGSGSLSWNLVSLNGQEIVSGIYLYSVVSSEPGFEAVIGRFVVIR